MNPKKFNELEDEMKQHLKERDDEIHGILLSVLAREHIFLVGSAGTGKSLMIRMVNDAVSDSNYFEWLFTRYTTPDEVFGSVKLSALKKDNYERNTEGKLPSSHFAFIDEIWKANSSILNSLLTIINERLYHNNGEPIECPLETMMSASNEIPNDREELNAMWDRFLMKFRVRQIQEDSAFSDMLTDDIEPIQTELSLDEIHEAQQEAQDIEVPDEVVENIVKIRKELRTEGIIPSDRRYKKSLKIVKGEAWLNDHAVAQVDDLIVLSHILWDDIDQISKVREIVTEITNPHLREADDLYDAVMDAWNKIQNADDEQERDELASEGSVKIKKAIAELDSLKSRMESEGKDTNRVESYIEKAKEIRTERIYKDILKL